MVEFYQRMQNIGTDLLTRFNQGTIVLQMVTPGAGPSYDPGSPTLTPVLLKGAARVAKGSVLLEPGTLVQAGDLKLTSKVITGLTRDPTTGDKIDLNGTRYTIVRFDKIPATGIPAAWVFYIRR